MPRQEGLDYAPTSEFKPVVDPGEFVFAAAALDHGHIYGQTNGLVESGATLKYVYDPDPAKVAKYRERYPQAQAVDSLDAILANDEVKLVASAAVPCERGPLGIQVMRAGKDYFTDKSPFTSLGQLADARAAVAETGRKYAVYYGERLHVESALYATELLQQGAIGRVLQVINLAPHRLSKASRPDWFFDKSKYGGILTDIGSHQCEQFLTFAGATGGTVNFARVENFNNPDKPGLEDFGEASFTMDNGVSCYMRLDWFTPDGMSAWGDGRVFVVGTEGTMEIRKYMDIGREGKDRIYLADGKEEQIIECAGRTGYPYFGELILDCLNGTENAMTQEHAFMSAELSMQAQAVADAARGGGA